MTPGDRPRGGHVEELWVCVRSGSRRSGGDWRVGSGNLTVNYAPLFLVPVVTPGDRPRGGRVEV